MNPILCPVRNNLHLTRQAVRTFRAQDIEGGVDIVIIDNHSTDGTAAWLATQRELLVMSHNPPLSVAASWNAGLRFVFSQGADYCLVVNNDVELRPDTYRHLVADGGRFVTAVGTQDPTKILALTAPNPNAIRSHPDFSCFLIRKETFEQVGPFDETFKIAYVEDCDMHVRLYRAGIQAYCLDLPFLHHGAQTIKHSSTSEIAKIKQQADKNRNYFRSKYGFAVASEEYYAYFGHTAPTEAVL